MTETADIAHRHVTALVDELREAGAIRSEEWAHAFAAVPRHVFVPRWYEQETNTKGIAVWRMHHIIHEDQLPLIYRDQTLVTALDPDTAARVDENAWTGIPTSSSTLPSLMAGMLEDLDVRDGQRVLEVGTGTGYNAALLCARLGEHLVHSVDIDPDLVRDAQRRLAGIGFLPELTVGDGRLGSSTGDHFDRIIATCSVPRIPAEWIEQTLPGGVILSDVALGIEGGLVRLTVDEEGRATGGFTATGGRFMAARSESHVYPQRERISYAAETGTRPSTVTAEEIRRHYPFRLVLAFSLPDVVLVYHSADDSVMSLQLQQADGSWARTPLAGDSVRTVTYGGDLELWQQVEAAWHWWNEAGCPEQDQFGYARETDGSVHIWHLPGGRHWDLSARS
ncbi:methyltransferase domain-containing protein [Streptomyces sp. NPDC005962]|uniref:methyltransferase domain-containing protein n=1 Tax=Streptomyces sp. NPDC005962 TaxID=3154466 RepID=UPI0033CDB587